MHETNNAAPSDIGLYTSRRKPEENHISKVDRHEN